MLKSFRAFFTHMDKQALRAVMVLVCMLIAIVVLIMYGRNHLAFTQGDMFESLAQVRGSVWAFPLTACIFIVAAFFGIPQWGLIAGTVLAFGPVYGAVFSWGATMLSASVNFWLARYLGADRLSRFGGDLINRITRLVRKNGFVTSFTVRLVPTGPFVMVNMAAGVSHMRFPAFLSGTALGIIPKILVIAFVSQGVSGAITQQKTILSLVSLALAVICITGMLWARSRLSSPVHKELVYQDFERSDKKDS